MNPIETKDDIRKLQIMMGDTNAVRAVPATPVAPTPAGGGWIECPRCHGTGEYHSILNSHKPCALCDCNGKLPSLAAQPAGEVSKDEAHWNFAMNLNPMAHVVPVEIYEAAQKRVAELEEETEQYLTELAHLRLGKNQAIAERDEARARIAGLEARERGLRDALEGFTEDGMCSCVDLEHGNSFLGHCRYCVARKALAAAAGEGK